MTAPPQDDNDWLKTQVDAVKTVLDEAYTDASRPFERIVTFPGGPPGWDCEMIAVWMQGMRHAALGTNADSSPIKRVGVKNVIVVGVDVLRCVTVFEKNDIPSAETITADGDAILTDAWVAWKALTRALIDGTLFGGCQAKHLSQLQPFQPNGGLTGFRIPIEVVI